MFFRLQGIINNLKKNYSDVEENTKVEIEKLSSQIVKAHKSITELEEKSAHFTRVNEKQYLDIWNMNTENANQLIKKVLFFLFKHFINKIILRLIHFDNLDFNY